MSGDNDWLLQHDPPLPIAGDVAPLKTEMDSQGYCEIDAETPPSELTERLRGIRTGWPSEDSTITYTICKDDSLVQDAYKYIFHGVNLTQICTQLLRASEADVCSEYPRIGRRSASQQASERWMVGPPGQPSGTAIVLVRLLNGDGGFSCARGPDSPEKRYTLRYDRVIALPSDGEVRHLESLEDCSFVALSYKTEARNVLADNYEEEIARVIPWVRKGY